MTRSLIANGGGSLWPQSKGLPIRGFDTSRTRGTSGFVYSSTAEIDFARSLVRSNQHFFAAVLRLKCLQYLGYFPEFYEIPTTVVNHVRICLRLSAQEMPAFDPMRTSDSDSRPLQLKPAYSRDARKVAVRKVFEAAQVMVNWNSA
jgi:hypothetical protein